MKTFFGQHFGQRFGQRLGLENINIIVFVDEQKFGQLTFVVTVKSKLLPGTKALPY